MEHNIRATEGKEAKEEGNIDLVRDSSNSISER